MQYFIYIVPRYVCMACIVNNITAVDCGDPEDLADGIITIPHTQYQSVITYSCGYGYILIGDRNRTCQENGLWSGQSPRCAGNIRYPGAAHFL